MMVVAAIGTDPEELGSAESLHSVRTSNQHRVIGCIPSPVEVDALNLPRARERGCSWSNAPRAARNRVAQTGRILA